MFVVSPILIPIIMKKNRTFKANKSRVKDVNDRRIDEAVPLEMPELNSLELTVLDEWKVKEGFKGDAGVSYLFKTEEGTTLFDVGHGPQNDVLAHNARKLNFDPNQVDAMVISHLHKDHMGGLEAYKNNQVMIPEELMPVKEIPCYLPAAAVAEGFKAEVITEPCLLDTGIVTTGPLARSLFMLGYTEEQALIIKLKDRGLVIFTGCGHPTIEMILKMVKKISSEPIYAIGGGLHFPLTEGRGDKAGFQLQRIFGTGKPPWQKVELSELKQTIATINSVKPEKVYLSGHDTCDFALDYFERNLTADTQILQAGETYQIK